MCWAVCYQLINISSDYCGNICTSFYYHHKAEIVIINHCLALGHETMVCVAYIYYTHLSLPGTYLVFTFRNRITTKMIKSSHVPPSPMCF